MAAALGVIGVLIGLLLNRYTIGYLVSADGEIGSAFYGMIIVIVRLGLVGLGAYLIGRRPVHP